MRDEVKLSTETALAARNPVAIALLIVAVRQAVFSAFSWAIGLFGLAASSYGVAKDCVKQYNRNDCILSSVGLVISAFGTVYKVKLGFSCDPLRLPM